MAVGAVLSAEALAGERVSIRVSGCTSMSANRLTVACCMLTSSVLTGPSWSALRPKLHCTVPAPKTSAPLVARYSVRWCVRVRGATVEPSSIMACCTAWSWPDRLIKPAGLEPLSGDVSNSYPSVLAESVVTCPAAVPAAGVRRQNRNFA